MAKQVNVYQPKGYTPSGAAITNADGTTAKLLVTPGADDSVIKAITLTSSDSVSRDVQIIARISATDYVIGTLTVPASSGTTGAAPTVDALSIVGLPLDRVNKKVLPLKSGTTLYVKATAAVTAATQITAFAVTEDF